MGAIKSYYHDEIVNMQIPCIDPEGHARTTAYDAMKYAMGDKSFESVFGKDFDSFSDWLDERIAEGL